jgi:hypothetical protein
MNGDCPTLIGLQTGLVTGQTGHQTGHQTAVAVMILLFWIQPVNQRKISIKTHSGI